MTDRRTAGRCEGKLCLPMHPGTYQKCRKREKTFIYAGLKDDEDLPSQAVNGHVPGWAVCSSVLG